MNKNTQVQIHQHLIESHSSHHNERILMELKSRNLKFVCGNYAERYGCQNLIRICAKRFDLP